MAIALEDVQWLTENPQQEYISGEGLFGLWPSQFLHVALIPVERFDGQYVFAVAASLLNPNTSPVVTVKSFNPETRRATKGIELVFVPYPEANFAEGPLYSGVPASEEESGVAPVLLCPPNRHPVLTAVLHAWQTDPDIIEWRSSLGIPHEGEPVIDPFGTASEGAPGLDAPLAPEDAASQQAARARQVASTLAGAPAASRQAVAANVFGKRGPPPKAGTSGAKGSGSDLSLVLARLESIQMEMSSQSQRLVALETGHGKAAPLLPGPSYMRTGASLPPSLPKTPGIFNPLAATSSLLQPSGPSTATPIAPGAADPWAQQRPTTSHGFQSPLSSLDVADGEMSSRFAKGSAGVAELVYCLETQPWLIDNAFEAFIRREQGALHSGMSWSVEDHSRRAAAALNGHRTLQKTLVILGHAYELFRLYPEHPQYAKAFIAQAYKVSLDAAQRNGSWALAWPLLGIPDPDENYRPPFAATEQVAMAALAKEKKALAEVAKAASPKKESSNNNAHSNPKTPKDD